MAPGSWRAAIPRAPSCLRWRPAAAPTSACRRPRPPPSRGALPPAAGGARLLLAGPVVMARDAARSIRADVDRIAIISTVLVVGLLAWRFRSMLVLAALAVPMVLSIALGVLLTGLFFGAVHAIALGFGITMLGITLDYPVLLIGHRKHGEAAPETLARIGGAFRLAVAVAVLGLAGLVFSGFPGLAQLGVLASTGLLAAAAATWWLLPPLVVAANLAPVAAGGSRWVVLVEGARRYRGVALGLAGLAACGLVAAGGPRWETDLAALSPVPAVSRALDAELRAAVGAAEAGQFVLVQQSDAEAVLRAQEALLPTLDRLVQQGVIGGYEAAAALLPSVQRQRRNQAALPSPEVLTARLAAAAAGLPFRPGSFQPFLDAVAEARTQQPWGPAEIAGTALALRLEPLLSQRGDAWFGPIRFRSVTDTALLRAALEGTGEVFIDVRTELEGILDGFRARAGWLLGGTGLVMLLALWAGLRQPARVLRVVGAVVAAQAVTLALLTVAGVRLSSIHLASLLLVAGVGLDYALFMAREGLDIEERARTLRTLITCNAMTLLTFGLLATCATPILHDIGVTIVLGAVCPRLRHARRGGAAARRMMPVPITAMTAVSALGIGRVAHLAALKARRTGLTPNDFDASVGGWVGRVAGVEEHSLPEPLARFDCRNNRLADMALQADGFTAAIEGARERYGANRIGVLWVPALRAWRRPKVPGCSWTARAGCPTVSISRRHRISARWRPSCGRRWDCAAQPA